MKKKEIEQKIESYKKELSKGEKKIKDHEAELKQLRTMRFEMDLGSTNDIVCYRDYDEDCRIQIQQGSSIFWMPAKCLRDFIDKLIIMDNGLKNSEFYPYGKEWPW